MRGATVFVVAIMMVCSASHALSGRAFYVSPVGNDSWTGSFASPWRTLQKANTTLIAGDTVFVRAGEYDGVISPANSGSAGQPIVYTRYGYELVTLVGESKAKKGVVGIGWNLATNSQGTPRSYIIVDGFVIRYKYAPQLVDVPTFSNRFGYVCIANPQSRFNEIRNCIIMMVGSPLDNYRAGYRQEGILIMDALDTRIENNEIFGMWLGILMSGGPPRRNLIRGNHIHDTGSSTIDNGDPENGEGGLQGNIIEYNVLSGSVNEDGVQFEQNYKGDLLSTTNTGTIIRYNIVRNCAENAFDLKGTANILIEGNIVYGNQGDDDGAIGGNDRSGGMGGVVHGANSASRDVIIRNNVFFDNCAGLLLESGYKVYNNTLVANNRDFTGPNSTYFAPPGPGFTGALAYDATGVVLKNNIFAEHARGEIAINLNGLTGSTIDNNLYSNNAGVYLCDAGGALFTHFALTEWRQRMATRGISGAEAHSIVASPGFRNAPGRPVGGTSSLDFSLSGSSPAIDAGTALTRTTSAGSGRTIPVEDPAMFFDGFGVTAGDSVIVGSAGAAVVTLVDRTNRTLQVNRSLTWNAGEPVNRPYNGSLPDIGAVEYAAGAEGFLQSPEAVYPLSSTTEINTRTTVHWKRVAGARTYHVQVSSTSNFSAVVFDRELICDTLAWVPALQSGRTYYWSVAAVAPGVQPAWSAPIAFQVTGPASSPQKTDVANRVANGDFESSTAPWTFFCNGSAQLALAAHNGGSAAQITVSSTGTNMQLNQSGLTIENGVRYMLQFSALNTSGSDLCVSLMSDVAPYTQYGLWSTLIDLTPGWKDYALVFDAKVPADSVTNARLLFWFVGNAKPGDVYQIDDVVLTPLLVDDRTLTAPTISTPAADAQDVPLWANITWASIPTAISYEIQVSADAAFIDLVDDRVTAECANEVGPLTTSSTFYVRMRSIGPNGASEYCAARAFTTTWHTDVHDKVVDLPNTFTLLQNYPNPFNPSTHIRYSVPARSFVSVRVYNVLGAQVAVVDEGDREAGVHEVTFDASKLASGQYFLRMISGSFVETKKLIVMK